MKYTEPEKKISSSEPASVPASVDELFIRNLLLILAYYANIHDFGILCTKKNQHICDKLLKSYKSMLISEISQMNESIDTYFEGNNYLITEYKNNIIGHLQNTSSKQTFSTFDKNKHVFIDFIKYIIDKKINSITKINFNDMQNIILTNFKLIFNGITNIDDSLNILDYIGINNIEIDTYDFIEFNEFLNKNKDENNIELFYQLKYVQKMIFLQRQQLYYLIHYHNIGSGERVEIMIKYFLQKIIEPEKHERYKHIIIDNLHKVKIEQNITFPITMFDDMSTDTLNSDYIDGLFKFKIINSDKENIDSATTFNGTDCKGQTGAQQVMFIQNEKKEINPVFFSEDDLNLTIKDYTYNFIQDRDRNIKYIVCKYNDIIFNVIHNSVGRSYNKKSKGKGVASAKGVVEDEDDEDDEDEDELEEKEKESSEKKKTKGLFQIIILIINILGKISRDITIAKSEVKTIITEKELDAIRKFIIIDEIFYESLLRLTKYGNSNEIIITLLFGVKEFGDRIQMEISKRNNFYLQTGDLLCKLYGILIKAPVLWIDNNYNMTAYNYDTIDTENIKNININFDPRSMNIIHRRFHENTGRIFGKTKLKTSIPKIITNLTNKITPFERIYYNKYIKYKTKYLELKKYL